MRGKRRSVVLEYQRICLLKGNRGCCGEKILVFSADLVVFADNKLTSENFLEIPSCGSLDETRREIFKLLNSLVTC